MTWHHIPTVQVPQLKICLLLSAHKTISYSSQLSSRGHQVFMFIKVKCTDVFHQEHCVHTQIS